MSDLDDDLSGELSDHSSERSFVSEEAPPPRVTKRVHEVQHTTSPNGRYVHHSEILGVGAAKTVYKAVDVELGTTVAWNEIAIKTNQTESVASLLNEVDLLRNLEHRNILKTMDAWILDDVVVFITELMPGGSLRKLIKKMGSTQAGYSVRVGALRNWTRQILDALIYLHQRHIVHRDLKCDNIFVDSGSGKITLGDLGLAKMLAEEGEDTHAKTFVGTPTHMAPEFFDEGGRYDCGVDVWAFGMCIIEMGTGEYPYSELSNKGQIFQKIANKELPERQLAKLPVEAARLARKCLRTRQERPTAAQLRQDPFFSSSGMLTADSAVVEAQVDEEEEADADGETSSVLEFEFVLHHDDASDVISFEFHALQDDARTDAAQLVEALGLDFAPDAIADAIQEQVDWFKERRFDEDFQYGVDNHIVVDIYAQETLVAPTKQDLRESEYLRPQFQSPPVSLELNEIPDVDEAERPPASPFKGLWEGKLLGFQVARASATPSNSAPIQKLGKTSPLSAQAKPTAIPIPTTASPSASPPATAAGKSTNKPIKSPKRRHQREYSLSNYNNLADRMLAGFSMEHKSEPKLNDMPHIHKPVRHSEPGGVRRRSLEVDREFRAQLRSTEDEMLSQSVPAQSPLMYRMDSTTAMLLADDDEDDT